VLQKVSKGIMQRATITAISKSLVSMKVDYLAH